ncbi:MAG: helix-turn-helix domain-containing protein [Firmicutes bacterium]|nr:helix-turn-helix domain-containing protein [Bacillota bacterium]
MLHISSLDEGLDLFKALGSDMRIQILKLLLENKQMSMNQIAARLDITNGALTGHIKKLEACGLISTSSESASHGNQKICTLCTNRILIDIENEAEANQVCTTELKVGQFSDRSVYPTCGLANSYSLIGEVDDARYFDHPGRFTADILWFTKGFVEYTVPNFIPLRHRILSISISCEISSEAPGCNEDWPSDIRFCINGTPVGCWTCPGDFGAERGILNPDWWPTNWNQHGLLKLLVINKSGTHIDGLKISDVTIDDLNLQPGKPIRFRMEVNEEIHHPGGLTIYGRSFGNYGQDIRVSLAYGPIDPQS